MAKSQPDSDAAWVNALQGALTCHEKLPPGEGWLTVHEVANKYGIAVQKTRTYLNEEVAAGRMETFTGSRNLAGFKGARFSVWYRPLSR